MLGDFFDSPLYARQLFVVPVQHDAWDELHVRGPIARGRELEIFLTQGQDTFACGLALAHEDEAGLYLTVATESLEVEAPSMWRLLSEQGPIERGFNLFTSHRRLGDPIYIRVIFD